MHIYVRIDCSLIYDRETIHKAICKCENCVKNKQIYTNIYASHSYTWREELVNDLG